MAAKKATGFEPRARRIVPGGGLAPTILALDMATHCGWAIRDPGGSMVSGVWDLSPPESSMRKDAWRFMEFRRELNDTLEGNRGCIDVIAYEDTRFFRGGAATRIYFGLLATLNVWAVESGGLPLVAVNVATVKKFATGKGNATKDQMIEAATLRWPGQTYEGDDEVDARWVAECGLELWKALRAPA